MCCRHWFKCAIPIRMTLQEFVSISQRNIRSTNEFNLQLRRYWLSWFFKTKNNMVWRYTTIKSTGVVEIDNFIYPIWRFVFFGICKCTTIPHRYDIGMGAMKSKKVSHSQSIKTLASSLVVVGASTTSASINYRFCNQKSIEWPGSQDFVRIPIISLPNAVNGMLLRDHFKVRVDLILAIRKKEFHFLLRLSWTYIRTRKLESSRICEDVDCKAFHSIPFIPSHRPLVHAQ